MINAASAAQPIQATLGSTATDLVPGASGKALTVTLNTNAYSIGVDKRHPPSTLPRQRRGGPAARPRRRRAVRGYNKVFTANGTADATDNATITVSMADLPTVDQNDCAAATFDVPVNAS